MEVLVVLFLFLFGLIFGSFFNVVIYRLPRKLSVVKPRSRCPQCGQALGLFELVPVFSFIWQKGACKSCGEPISWRYPVVELAAGLGFALVGYYSTSFSRLVVGLILFSYLLILALIDLEHKILPNELTLSGVVLGLLFSLFGWTISFGQSILGLVVGVGILLALALIYPGGIGMGDVKLLGFIGTILGWKYTLFTLFLGSVFGTIGGLIYLYLTGQGRKTPIPFGPCLALAAFILYFFT